MQTTSFRIAPDYYGVNVSQNTLNLVSAACEKWLSRNRKCNQPDSKILRLKRGLPLTLRYFREVESGCWEWYANLNKAGYGVAFAFGMRGHIASRLIFQKIHGILPDHIFVCHKCDNPKCVRPGHLFAGTQSQNIQDSVSKSRHSSIVCNPCWKKYRK